MTTTTTTDYGMEVIPVDGVTTNADTRDINRESDKMLT
jgi:hypothetical protein